MNANLLKTTMKFIEKNQTFINTVLVSTGLIAAVVAAVKETPKANMLIAEKGEDLTKIETAKLVFKGHWKSISISAATLLLVFYGNKLRDKSYAGLASAYALSQKSIKEYKDAVLEVVGDKKEEEVKKKITETKMRKAEAERKFTDDAMIIDTGHGNTLFYDEWTGRPFKCDYEYVRRVVNDTERKRLEDDMVSLEDFYFELGLPTSACGQKMGWNTFNGERFDVEYSSMLLDDGRPVCVISFKTDPIYNYECCNRY